MKVNVLKKDSKVNFEITPQHLHKFQKILMYLMADKTQEDINKLEELMKSQEFEKLEEWMEHFFFLTVIIAQVEEEAVKSNQTYEKEIEDQISQQES